MGLFICFLLALAVTAGPFILTCIGYIVVGIGFAIYLLGLLSIEIFKYISKKVKDYKKATKAERIKKIAKFKLDIKLKVIGILKAVKLEIIKELKEIEKIRLIEILKEHKKQKEIKALKKAEILKVIEALKKVKILKVVRVLKVIEKLEEAEVLKAIKALEEPEVLRVIEALEEPEALKIIKVFGEAKK